MIKQIRVTQALIGSYEGTLEIEATTRKEALEIARNMDKGVIDDLVEWAQCDEYFGDIESIEIEE